MMLALTELCSEAPETAIEYDFEIEESASEQPKTSENNEPASAYTRRRMPGSIYMRKKEFEKELKKRLSGEEKWLVASYCFALLATHQLPLFGCYGHAVRLRLASSFCFVPILKPCNFFCLI